MKGGSDAMETASWQPWAHRPGDVVQQKMTKYHNVVYKSRLLYTVFQLLSVASIQVRLLFEGGLYADPDSSNPIKSVWHKQNESETWPLSVKQTF